jgi:hypothetical protein
LRKSLFFAGKLVKITKKCDHNIDPNSSAEHSSSLSHHKNLRSYAKRGMFEKQGKFFSADLFCEAKRDFVDG